MEVNVNVVGADLLEALLNKQLSGSIAYDSVTSMLEPSTFAEQTLLENVSLPNINGISEKSFHSCSALKTVNIPKCTTLPDYAFQSCKALTSLTTGTLTTIGQYSMQYTESFLVDFVANSVAALGATAFRGSGIKSFKGNKLGTINNYALAECPNLTTVDIGSTSTVSSPQIKTSAFQNSTALTALIIRNTSKTFSLAAVNALSGTPIADGTGFIYVPDSLVDTYKAATNWSTYAAQIKPLSELPTT